MRLTLAAAAILGAAFSLGCGSEEEKSAEKTPDPRFVRQDIPAPPDGGLQWVSKTFTVPAGEERFYCMRIATVEEDLFIQSGAVYQVEGGHHVIAFHTTELEDQSPDPHVCDGGEMSGNIRFATVGAADGTGVAMPEGVAMKIPAGAEIWTQSHYVNASDEDVLAQDVINLELVAAEDVSTLAGTFAQSDFSFDLQPRQETTRTMECAFTRELTIPWLVPHMHEWGKEYLVEILKGDEVVWSTSGAWTAALRNDIPIQELAEHITVTPEHKVRTTCTWANTGDAPLAFPEEMCVTFFPFYPADGEFVLCDEEGVIAGGGPTSGLVDQCLSAEDQAIIADPATDAAIEACGFSCLAGGPCECLVNLGFSEGCATCYGDNIACAAGACLDACLDSASAECRTCVNDKCLPAFDACTGL